MCFFRTPTPPPVAKPPAMADTVSKPSQEVAATPVEPDKPTEIKINKTSSKKQSPADAGRIDLAQNLKIPANTVPGSGTGGLSGTP